MLPLGTDEVRNRAVSLFLQAAPLSAEQDWHICARLMLVMRNPQHDSCMVAKTAHHRYQASESDWGFTSFVTPRQLTRGDLATENHALLEDDQLVVAARIQVIKDPTGMLWHNFIK